MPDAPKADPGFEEAPDSKKQKREHAPSDAQIADVAADVANTAEQVDSHDGERQAGEDVAPG